MTIPHDLLQRWWVEASSVNPERVNELRPVLLGFLAFGPGKQPSLAGSGFIIAGNRESVLALTAKHVLTEGVARAQRPWSRSVPSSPFARAEHLPNLDPHFVKITWMGHDHADMLNLEHVNYNDGLDIACCIVTPQEGPTLSFQPYTIPIDTAVPNVGDLVHLVSLGGQSLEEHQPPDASGAGQMLGIRRHVSIRVGVVTGVFVNGLRHYRWPCFTTSIPAEPGMSGGFVTLPRDGTTIAACGIVCADNSTEEARIDQRLCGESVIACAWPALALRAPETLPPPSSAPAPTLYNWMRAGRMDVPIGGIEHIDIQEGENGDCRIGFRPTRDVC